MLGAVTSLPHTISIKGYLRKKRFQMMQELYGNTLSLIFSHRADSYCYT